jgi:hypothetical protein
MSNVFISYSHVDSNMAHELGSAIEHLGITYFHDVKHISWGERIEAAVQAALDNSNSLLVIISPASLKSLWVPYEIGYFSALKRPILPFLTHPSLELPAYISNLKHVYTVSEATNNFATMKDQLENPRAKQSAPNPDLRVRYSAAIVNDSGGGFATVFGIIAENHDIDSVFVSSFALLLRDGRRLQIIRDGVTGLPVGTQELRPGQRSSVHIRRSDLAADLKPTDIIGVVVIDQIGRQFYADPIRIQECIEELFHMGNA